MPLDLLPFKTLPKQSVETVDIGDETSGVLSIPKHGCLTVNEELAIAAYYMAVPSETPLAAAKVEVVAILLQSRLNKDLTTADVKALPDFGLVEKLYDFVLGERRRWQEPQPVAENAEATAKND